MIVGAIALFLPACGSASTAAPTTIAPVIATTVAETTTPPTTSTTSPPTTTSSTTTTTEPATTTTAVPTETLIKQAVQDYAAAYHACGVEPAACDATTFTADQGPSRTIVKDLAESMTRQGLHFLPDARGSYIVAESVIVVSATEATAIYCVFDAGTVLGPNAPDGSQTIVNDQVLSFRNEYRLYLEEAHWRVGEKNELEHLGEGNLCPPAA